MRLAYDTITMLSDRDPATGGGENYKRFNYFHCHCCGRGDLPSNLQMARQARQKRQLAGWMPDHLKKKEEAPDCMTVQSGASFFNYKRL